MTKTSTARVRYCEMCDRWTKDRICSACGADTVKAAKESK